MADFYEDFDKAERALALLTCDTCGKPLHGEPKQNGITWGCSDVECIYSFFEADKEV